MPSKVKDAAAACGSIFLIILGYYLILSNQGFLSSLNEGNRLLYAFISVLIMILLGALMGVTWDFLDKLFGAESLGLKGK